MDKPCEVLREVLLFLCHVIQFRLAEVIHEVLAHQMHEIAEHAALFLASVARNVLAPFLQVFHLSSIGQTHEHDKHIQEVTVLVACIQCVQCLQPAAVGDACYAMGCIRLYASLVDECFFYRCFVDALDVDALRTAENRFQQLLWMFAYQDEYCLLWRFLQQLQQLIGTRQVHTLWQPDDGHLVSALTRFQRQFSRQFVALSTRDNGLLVGSAHCRHPLFNGEVGTFFQQRNPLFHKVVAHRLVVASHRGQLDGWEGEMQVGMCPFAQHRLVLCHTWVFGCHHKTVVFGN